MIVDGFDTSILAPSLTAGLLVVISHVPMGREVLRRGIIFIDLAIAQIAGLGLIAAQWFGADEQFVIGEWAAVASALLGALALRWTERHWPEIQEALIGVTFVLAATGALLLLANNPHGGEHLKDLLSGQILWVGWTDLLVPLLVTVAIMVVWLMSARRDGLLFYVPFALLITQSVQLVGVYLVFSSLILPALATHRLAGRRGLVTGWLVGACGYAIGLTASALFDLPSGPTVVWTLAGLAVVAAAVIAKLVPVSRPGPQHSS